MQSVRRWLKKLKVIIPIGLVLACLPTLPSCATTCAVQEVQPIKPPEYITEPCEYPEPRDIADNEDMLDLLTDFANALDICATKHQMLVKYLP